MTTARKPLPRHVQAALIDTGVMDEERVTAKPSRRTCQRCGSRIVAALVDGTRADCDPTPLTALGELQALVAGVPTYTDGGTWMAWRSVNAIPYRPPNKWRVLPAHECGRFAFDYRIDPRPSNALFTPTPEGIPF